MRFFILSAVGIAIFLFSQTVSGFQIGNKSQILKQITSRAEFWNVEPALVKAIVRVESNFNPTAKNPADPSYGLMQITPMLAQDYGRVKDWRNPTKAEISMLYEPVWNLDIGCPHLSKLRKKYSFDIAVQMFNTGEYGYISGVRNSDYLQKVKVQYGIYN